MADLDLIYREGNLVDLFPGILYEFIRRKSPKDYERNSDIMAKRFKLNGEKFYTLDEIGTYYDLTRERVRQIEARIIKQLNQFLSGHIHARGWYIDEEIYSAYNALQERKNRLDFVLTDTEARNEFEDSFGSQFPEGYFDLFMEVLGYTNLPNSINGFRGTLKRCWCENSRYDRKSIEATFSALDVIFDRIEEVEIFDLTVQAKKRAKKVISTDIVHTALKACGDLEQREGKVSVKVQSLRGTTDKAYRILTRANEPIHYSELTRQINVLCAGRANYRPVQDVNLKNQLVSDGRFVPVGRSGYWGLASWSHMNRLTIVESLEKILHTAGKPLPFKEIRDRMEKMRPDASENSIRTYLGNPEKFVAVRRGTYGLSSWRLPRNTGTQKRRIVSNAECNDAIEKAFNGKSEVELRDLVRDVMHATGLKEGAARNRVHQADHLVIRSRSDGTTKYVERVGEPRTQAGPPEKELLRDRVQREVRAILYARPNVPITKGHLYQELTKVIDVQRPTFYAYVADMRDIKQYKKNNKSYVLYEHEEEVDRISIEVKELDLDNEVRKDVSKAVARLTRDEIDIGLFELGRLFEERLKSYLRTAKSAGEINVYSKDLNRLVDMINCVVREGVVSKGHHLHTIREERNNRAHGGRLSSEEKAELFNRGHYLADLFVQYIEVFDKKCRGV